MGASVKETVACQHCGAEADLTIEGFEGVQDVLRRQKKLTCKTCGKEITLERSPKRPMSVSTVARKQI